MSLQPQHNRTPLSFLQNLLISRLGRWHHAVGLILSVGLFLHMWNSPSIGQTAATERVLILERIEIQGNTKTKDEIIQRHLTLKVGEDFEIGDLLQRLETDGLTLRQTNFFKDVDYYTRPGSEKGKIVVVFEVKERKWPFFQFEGGHNDLDGWYFVPASLRFDNFFGNGSLLGIRFVLGDQVDKLSLGYLNPRAFGGRGFLDVEVFGGGQNFVHYLAATRTSQNVDFGGLRLKVGGNTGLFKHVHLGYRRENFTPDAFLKFPDMDSSTTSLPPDISDDLGKTRVAALSLLLQADTRDNPIYPLNGFWGALSFDAAHNIFGSDRDFAKITLDTRFYRQVSKRNVFAFHLKAGFSEESAPFYERFFLGGANSLRGYRDRRLTPSGWGTKLLLTNTEFRFPISQKNFPFHKVSGVLFFDAGGVWLPGQRPRLQDFYSAAGLGFRVKIPVLGVTRFDFSFPLNNVDNEDFEFHVSLGHTF